jgi:hypothetical protein
MRYPRRFGGIPEDVGGRIVGCGAGDTGIRHPVLPAQQTRGRQMLPDKDLLVQRSGRARLDAGSAVGVKQGK